MRKKGDSRSAFFNLRILIAFAFCFLGVVLAVLALESGPSAEGQAQATAANAGGAPRESRLSRAGRSFSGDLRTLPYHAPVKRERPELEQPLLHPRLYQPQGGTAPLTAQATIPGPSAPAPGPSITFDGLDFANWGAGHPPDENGDV